MIFNIEVNRKTIQARKGETILTTLNRNGFRVPTLCNVRGLFPSGACRICVVEVEGYKNLITACSHIVEEGMKISTHSPRVLKARKTLIELLLSNHPDDCLYCERNGNCELQAFAIELNIRERRISGSKSRRKIDLSSPSIVRDPAKCILCGRCVRICDEIQSVSTLEFINRGCRTVVGTSMNKNLNSSSCIACGQCVMFCPTAALKERTSLDQVQDALNNNSVKVAIQLDAAVSVSLSQEFGMKPGKDITELLVTALKRIGFDFVFDTSFAADLMVIETVSELTKSIEQNESLPLISSNCPAWIRYAEQFYPDLLPLLSKCKSPQQIMGAVIKFYFAQSLNIKPNSIYSVAVTPCLARKYEANRVGMTSKGISDVDAVLSCRELVRLIKLYGIDMQNINPRKADSPFDIRSTSGKLFANAGGLSEAIIRTMHHTITGKEFGTKKINDFRSINGVKESEIKIGKESMKMIVCSGLKNIDLLLSSIATGEKQAHYIEIMACPGGCNNGGGQPFGINEKDGKVRVKAIYEIDEMESIRSAHKNPMISELYKLFIETLGSEKIEKILHVDYTIKDT